MRRRSLNMLGLDGDNMGLKYKIGEFVGDGMTGVTIEHGLGEVPFIFAFIGEEGEETAGAFAGMMMNVDIPTRYTSTVTKNWIDTGANMINDGTNVIALASVSSTAYGVNRADENSVTIYRYGSNQNFVSGKIYKWIAIADWRS